MKYEAVIGIAVLVFVAAIALVMPVSQDDHRQPSAPFETSYMAETQDQNVSGKSAKLPQPHSDSHAGVHSELPAQSIELVQYVDEGSCSTCSQPEGNCQCENSCDSCGSADCDGKNCGRGRLRQSQLLPAGAPCIEQSPGPVKSILGVNECVASNLGREATFQDSQMVPWEMFAWGEYVGPERTPHVPEYRLRVGQYRALFEIENENEIIVYRVVHRRNAYR